MKGRPKFFLILFTAIFVYGCDSYTQNDYQKKYVIESYLVAGRNLPPVRVSKTLPIDKRYSFQKAALNNATVSIQQLDSSDTIEKNYLYQRISPGTYVPENHETVLPLHRYKLIVSFPNGDSVTAETLVPGEFRTTGSIRDSIIYKSTPPLAVNITPSSYPERQSYYIFTVNAMDTTASELTPFYADIVNNDDNKIYDYYINSSGIINQKNYKKNPDGTITLKVPWLSFAFYGKNKIVANAIDDNYYDFVRSQSVQTGGGMLPPGQIQNIFYHVKGGIGIFGSLASDTVSVFIKRE
jgi:hypothetical protein